MRIVLKFPRDRIIWATILRRPNRFLGIAKIGDSQQLIHIHDPGRIPLLKPGTRILILNVEHPKRKTKYDLLTFKWRDEWIFSHSGYHSKIFEKTVRFLNGFQGHIRREVKLGKSRIDFSFRDIFVEVKGCTWIVDNFCCFPDAPTSRGRRHLLELAEYASHRNKAYIVFLAFSKYAKKVRIARSVDPEFYEAAIKARNMGVRFLGLKYKFDEAKLIHIGSIPVDLENPC